MQSQIKVVFFDIGGVLVSQKEYDNALEKFLEETLGVKPQDSIHTYISKLHEDLGLGAITSKDFWQLLTKKLNKPYLSLFDTFFEKIAKTLRIRKKMIALAQMLKQNGVTTGILSNLWEDTEKQYLKRDMYHHFDLFILSHKIHMRKPHENIFVYTIKKAAVRPEEILFIDDKPENITAAQNLGINGIIYKNTRQVLRDIKHYHLL